MTYTFTSNGVSREFTVREVFRIRDEAVLTKLFTGHETMQAAAVAIIHDEQNFNEFMRSTMVGDHEGWSWFDVEERATVAEAVAEAMRFFTNTGKSKPGTSKNSHKSSTKKAR